MKATTILRRLAAASTVAMLIAFACGTGTAHADDRPPGAPAPGEKHAPGERDPEWYERIHIRGYTQFRYNRIGASNPELRNDQGDRSIGDPGGFFVRRARLVLFGDMTSWLSI